MSIRRMDGLNLLKVNLARTIAGLRGSWITVDRLCKVYQAILISREAQFD